LGACWEKLNRFVSAETTQTDVQSPPASSSCTPLVDIGRVKEILDNGAARLHYGRGLQATVMDPPSDLCDWRDPYTIASHEAEIAP